MEKFLTKPIVLGLIIMMSLLAGSSLELRAQTSMKFTRIGAEQGLSQKTVNALEIDSNGLLWVGTLNGLNHYDGHEFVQYKHDQDDPNSIPDNLVTDIFLDSNDDLWISTISGLAKKTSFGFDVFVPNYGNTEKNVTQAIDLYISSITKIDGVFWLATKNGLQLFDPLKKIFSKPAFVQPLLGADIASIVQDETGDYWIASQNKGLFKISADKKHIISFSDTDINFTKNTVSLFSDSFGRIWVGTRSDGVFIYNESKNRFETPRLLAQEPWFSLQRTENTGYIIEPDPGVFHVGTYGKGLFILDENENSVNHVISNEADPFSLSSDLLKSTIIDDNGVFWVGTFDGLNQFSPWRNKFDHYYNIPGEENSIVSNSVVSVLVDSKGNEWVGTANGVTVIPADGSDYIHFKSDPKNKNTLRTNAILSLYEDSKGRVWGTHHMGGLSQIDLEKKTVKRFLSPEQVSDRNISLIADMIEQEDGSFLLATFSGLVHFHPSQGILNHFKHDVSDDSSISFNQLWVLHESKAGEIWTGSLGGGLNRFNQSKGTFTRFTTENSKGLTNNRIVSMDEDEDGNLWLGTVGGGVVKFDPQTSEFTPFSLKDGLPDDAILGVRFDNNNQLWLTHTTGLSKFDPITKEVLVYNGNDGIQQLEFNANTIHKTPDGMIYIGGANGMNKFHPDEVRRNPKKPDVFFRKIELFLKPFPIDEPNVLNKILEKAPTLRFNYNQNIITLHYGATDFSLPSNKQYAYQLSPLDDDWIQAGNQNSVTYTYLKPGKYTLKVKAANSDGIWNENYTSLNLLIQPPWWQTWWAYLLYIGALIAIMWKIFEFRSQQLKRQSELKVLKAKEQAAMVELENKELRIKTAELQAQAIEVENARKTEELEEARHLQVSMLPQTLPELKNVELCAFTRTATEVGGDFYDIIVDKDNSSFITYVGDATGHGMRAGIMVTITKALTQALTNSTDDISETVSSISKTIKNMNMKRMNMCLSAVKVTDNRVEIVSGGMPYSIYYSHKTKKASFVESVGVPLGTLKKFDYPKKEFVLEQNDVLLIYSDGIIERDNSEEEHFGMSRLREQLEKNVEMPLDELLPKLVATSDFWADSDQNDDDITLLAIRKK